MKKTCSILLLALMLALSGCAQEAAEATAPTQVEATVPETTQETVPEASEETVPETTEETVPEPQVTEITAQLDGIPAILTTLSRGDTVEVVGTFEENYYVVKLEAAYGLVEKSLLSPADQEEYASWTGYAYYQAELHDDLRLYGEPVEKLAVNAQVEVLEDLGWCYLVRYEDALGYISTDGLSQYPIRGNSGGGGGGADGGDISMFAPGASLLSLFVPQEGEPTGEATVLADGTQALLGWFHRGDMIPLVTEEGFAEPMEGCRTVYVNGIYAYVPEQFAPLEGTYEAWTGYTRWGAAVYDDIWLLEKREGQLSTNTEVTVLYELDHGYLVEIGGVTGYMEMDMVSRTRYSGGGGSGSGGGEWSPPVL